MKRKTHEQFCKEMQEKHPTLIILGTYKNGRTKVNLKCSVCGFEFAATPGSLWAGSDCPKCACVVTKTNEEFLSEFREKNHHNITPLEEYKNNHTKIKFLCNDCGNIWNANPQSILRGQGCGKCSKRIRKTQEEFVNQMKEKHPNIEVVGEYVNNRVKVECKCKTCGKTFMGTPHAMLDGGNDCPNCKVSTGERKIQEWLQNKGIAYLREHTFCDCKDKHVLPFDFYIPSKNAIIEFDGRQHYFQNDYFGGKDGFDKTQQHDKIKTDYCLSNNINLIRIPYWDINNISTILNNELAS